MFTPWASKWYVPTCTREIFSHPILLPYTHFLNSIYEQTCLHHDLLSWVVFKWTSLWSSEVFSLFGYFIFLTTKKTCTVMHWYDFTLFNIYSSYFLYISFFCECFLNLKTYGICKSECTKEKLYRTFHLPIVNVLYYIVCVLSWTRAVTY